MNSIRLSIWVLIVLMTIAPIFTALNDGSFTGGGRQKLTFPMSYHYEALYGNIFAINAVNYFILKLLPALPVLYHAGIYAACFIGSWYLHRSWAPRSGEEPTNHFFRKVEYSDYPFDKKGWWKSFSPAGWMHLFFLLTALTLAIEYTFFARHLPASTVLIIGSLYFGYCLVAVMGYQTAICRAPLQLGYNKAAELTVRFTVVALVTIVKLL